MLQPKKTKYRKAFKGRIHGNAKGGTVLNFGSYGLKALEPERITARQIEAARRERPFALHAVRRGQAVDAAGAQRLGHQSVGAVAHCHQ